MIFSNEKLTLLRELKVIPIFETNKLMEFSIGIFQILFRSNPIYFLREKKNLPYLTYPATVLYAYSRTSHLFLSTLDVTCHNRVSWHAKSKQQTSLSLHYVFATAMVQSHSFRKQQTHCHPCQKFWEHQHQKNIPISSPSHMHIQHPRRQPSSTWKGVHTQRFDTEGWVELPYMPLWRGVGARCNTSKRNG